MYYSELRAGALMCEYRSEDANEPTGRDSGVFVGVLPIVGQDQGFRLIPDEWSITVDDGGYFDCPGMDSRRCLFGKNVGGYQVVGMVTSRAVDRSEARRVFEGAVAVVAALDEPDPLWEPEGGSLRAVAAPEEFLALDAIAETLGVDTVYVAKAEGGENAAGFLKSASLTGAYWASFGVPGTDQGVHLAVLPGGATYYDTVKTGRVAGGSEVLSVAGLGDDAYVSTRHFGGPEGSGRAFTYLDVKVKNSWLQLNSTSPEGLERLAREVIANLS
ncbi:hypothetical protein ASF88_11910 [Leifsonia sp. Leaf336]|nr:hypothetical protein ASF88_11910 [Leifsonia sp. Leaf336]